MEREILLKTLKRNNKSRTFSKDSNILHLENDLKDKIGINVEIKNKRNSSGQLVFNYKDLDQLNRLIMIIKANY